MPTTVTEKPTVTGRAATITSQSRLLMRTSGITTAALSSNPFGSGRGGRAPRGRSSRVAVVVEEGGVWSSVRYPCSLMAAWASSRSCSRSAALLRGADEQGHGVRHGLGGGRGGVVDVERREGCLKAAAELPERLGQQVADALEVAEDPVDRRRGDRAVAGEVVDRPDGFRATSGQPATRSPSSVNPTRLRPP